MTEAQALYAKTDHRTFSINWKTYSEEMREELNAIHAIQLAIWKLDFQKKHPSEIWTKEIDDKLREHLFEIVKNYVLIYGTFELNPVEFLADLKLDTNYKTF